MGRKLSLDGQTLKRLAKPDSLSGRLDGDPRTRPQRCEVAQPARTPADSGLQEGAR